MPLENCLLWELRDPSPILGQSYRLRRPSQVGTLPCKTACSSNLDCDDGQGPLDRRRDIQGTDDGELFVEYSESEALMFDNGRLKTANFNTEQGFGLRAVAGEATGYAHASELSQAALLRAADAVSAVKAGYSGTLAEAPAAHQPPSLRRGESDRLALLRRQGEAAAGDRRLAARRRSARPPGHRFAGLVVAACRDRARRRADRARRAPAGAHECRRRGRRRRPAGIRLLRHGRQQGLWRVPGRGQLEARREGGAAPGAGQSRGHTRAGRNLRHRAVLGLAGRDAARGGRTRT